MRIFPPCLGKLLQEHPKHLSWRGWVWLPPGTVLTPLFQGFGAGEELGCREKAPFWLWTDPIWRVATQVVLAVTGLAAEGCGTSTLARPSWWHLLPHWHCCPSVSAIPASLLSLGVHRAGIALSPPPAAAPLRCSHQTQHGFKSLSIFNENFCVYAFLASARRYFGHRRCSASPGIGDGSVFLLALARWGVLFGAGHGGGTAAGSRHIPIPGSTSRCQLCQPTPQHGTGLGGIPASHGCSSVAGWEGDTWKPQQAEPRGKTNSP